MLRTPEPAKRYLLFSTDFRTEGLIYASSGFHWKDGVWNNGGGTTVSVTLPCLQD